MRLRGRSIDLLGLAFFEQSALFIGGKMAITISGNTRAKIETTFQMLLNYYEKLPDKEKEKVELAIKQLEKERQIPLELLFRRCG